MISILLFLAIQPAFAAQDGVVVIGSKKFTESVILGEISRIALEQKDHKAIHKSGLGGTRILWNALVNGDIDLYVEYTGTLAEEILREPFLDLNDLRIKLARHGVGALDPLGFNNTYAIGMKRSKAEQLGIYKISDLAKHPQLKFGWGEEFRMRRDGWPGLKLHYKLPQRFVRGLDHDIAYRALDNGDIHVTELYSTDAEIEYHDILVLEDDLRYFPRYEALYLYKLNNGQPPEFVESLQPLSGLISNSKMIDLNNEVKIKKRPSGEVASNFLDEALGWKADYTATTRTQRMVRRTKEHMFLVAVSLLTAILFAVPLGIVAYKYSSVGSGILSAVGIIQTIPSLALLVILIRPLNLVGLSGIGDTPALIALFLYSLLPIVRSTHSGLQQISNSLRETANALGLRARTQLFRIELPLALPSIMSGIKTAAVINVGFATLGALVGAGGFGQPILTGIRLDDYPLILEGAVPAALLAIAVQRLFDLLEARIVSEGLR